MPLLYSGDFKTDEFKLLFSSINIAKDANGNYRYKLLDPMPKPQIQEGQICKLSAISVVINWLHRTHPETPLPNPTTKRMAFFDDPSRPSIRALAKLTGSQVGEVYSTKTLCDIASMIGYNNNEVLTAQNSDDYCNNIIRLLDSGQPAICFYDVGHDSNGEPAKLNGEREHATVIVGYYYDKQDKLNFIVTHWGKYFAMNAKDFAESAAQLEAKRTPEIFIKYQRSWYDAMPQLYRLSNNIRFAQASPFDDGGMRNKIVVVKNPQLELSHEANNKTLRR